MARRTARTAYRIKTFPRRLFYKTKRVLMTPVRKIRTHHHTTGTTTTQPTTTTTGPTHRRKMFGRKHKRAGPRTHNLFGFAVRKDPNNPHHHRRQSKLRSLLHRRVA